MLAFDPMPSRNRERGLRVNNVHLRHTPIPACAANWEDPRRRTHMENGSTILKILSLQLTREERVTTCLKRVG